MYFRREMDFLQVFKDFANLMQCDLMWGIILGWYIEHTFIITAVYMMGFNLTWHRPRSSENLEMKAFEKFENAVFFQDIQNSFW